MAGKSWSTSDEEETDAEEESTQETFSQSEPACSGVDAGGVVAGFGDLCGQRKDWHDDHRTRFVVVEGRETPDYKTNSLEPVCRDDG